MYPLAVSVQLPPFWHGLDAHTLLVTWPTFKRHVIPHTCVYSDQCYLQWHMHTRCWSPHLHSKDTWYHTHVCIQINVIFSDTCTHIQINNFNWPTFQRHVVPQMCVFRSMLSSVTHAHTVRSTISPDLRYKNTPVVPQTCVYSDQCYLQSINQYFMSVHIENVILSDTCTHSQIKHFTWPTLQNHVSGTTDMRVFRSMLSSVTHTNTTGSSISTDLQSKDT